MEIDHASSWVVGNHEDGYLIGVNNLIEIFTEVISSSSTSPRTVPTTLVVTAPQDVTWPTVLISYVTKVCQIVFFPKRMLILIINLLKVWQNNHIDWFSIFNIKQKTLCLFILVLLIVKILYLTILRNLDLLSAIGQLMSILLIYECKRCSKLFIVLYKVLQLWCHYCIFLNVQNWVKLNGKLKTYVFYYL